jgi:eukaryotic-like serine/threonine-protein kinase
VTGTSRFLPRVLAGRYRLMRSIGGGGMGKVFQGEIVRTGLPVAVKMLHPLLAQDEQARMRLERECALVAQVDHDALVPILDIDEDFDGTPFMVMELLRGEDLRARLDAEKALPPRDAVWIAYQVADALAAVHRAHVIHRDLKPENIFLQRQRHVDLRVRIVDFGIAKARERLSGADITLTRDGQRLGTPGYMSPEQARGDTNLDPRSDVYSLAVVLYEMLTGGSPYPGGDDAMPNVMLVIIQEREPILLRKLRPDASKSLEDLLSRAMMKDRSRRIADMEELMAGLSAIAAEPLPGAPVTELEWGDGGSRQGHSRPSLLGRASEPTLNPLPTRKKPRRSTMPKA